MNVEVNDIILVRFFSKTTDQLGINARHYKCTAVTGAGCTLQEFADVLGAAVAISYKSLLSTGATYQGITAQRVWPEPPSVQVINRSGEGQGNVSGNILPKQTCGVISFQTEFAGRQYRGRLYLPFQGVDVNGPLGQPLAAHVTNMATLGTNLLTTRTAGAAGNTSTLGPGLPVRVQIPGSDPPRYELNGFFTFFTNRVARSIWGTQRRRGDYGKKNLSPLG